MKSKERSKPYAESGTHREYFAHIVRKKIA
jgi:hypothetical protein